MKKYVFTFCLLFSSLSMAKDTLRFATEASYAPFEFIGSDNTLQGFDIDLAHAICHELKKNCSFTNQEFDALIPSLNFRRFDAIIANLDITPARQKLLAFSMPYYSNKALFIGRKSEFNDINQLSGKSVGIQNGTTHQAYLANKHAEITMVSYASYQNAILDLKSGRIDAIFGDYDIVNHWLTHDASLSPIGTAVLDNDYFGAGVAIAVRKNNPSLLDNINNALIAIKDNGTYQAIYDKWFNLQSQRGAK